jgi:ELWxxDGT repeat protein
MPILAWAGKAYFAANNGTAGQELWVSDGTEAGTRMLKDINPGAGASQPDYFTVYQGKLYFAATGPAGRELWVSDGTEAGTVQLKDISVGADSSGPTFLCVAGNTLYFSASGAAGRELWKSDGTAVGTVQVADLPSFSSGSKPSDLIALGSKVCFVASTLEEGDELFISDGTAAGTKLVKNINPGSFSSYPSVLRVAGGKLYFGASPESGSTKEDIWVSDGTAEGTKIIIPDGFLLDVVELNGKAIIGTSNKLYVSDGTAPNTLSLVTLDRLFERNINRTRRMAVAGGLAYFPGERSFSTGREIWASDGTAGGTRMVADISSGFFSSDPAWLTPIGNKLFFAGDHDRQALKAGIELLETDGTDNGTKLAADINPNNFSSYPGPIVALNNNTLVFMAETRANGRELWKYNLSTATSVPEIRHQKDLLAFAPNPSPGWIQVRSLRTDAGEGILRIYNLLGQVVQQERLRPGESRNIDLSRLAKGSYTLHLQQGIWLQVEKLVLR